MNAPVVSPVVQSTDQLPDIIQRVVNGERIQDLALENGVNRKTIYEWIFSGLGDAQYHDVMTKAMIARIAEADEELEGSTDKVAVARARAMAQLTRMDFERRRPKLYGPKQEISTDKTVNVYVHRAPQHIDCPQAIEAADPQVIDIVKGEANGSG